MDLSEKGVYCLVFENQACRLEIGIKGELSFPAGFHIYVGSALGPGGLKRVTRHINLSRNKDKKPKWHVDYINLDPSFRLVSAICAITPAGLECSLASRIGGDSVPGFGCTDLNAILIFYIEKNVLFGRLLKLLKLSSSRVLCLNLEPLTFPTFL
jgi:Uri superfamily endonuclease